VATTTVQPDVQEERRSIASLLRRNALVRRSCLIVASIVLLYLIILPLDWTQQIFLSVSLITVAMVINRLSKMFSATLLLAAISVFSSTRYIYYRFTNTFGVGAESGPQPRTVDMVFMVILLLAELYAFVILLLGYFQTVRPLGRKPAPLPENSNEWPTVDIFIPSYNEPLSVVRYTVWAAMNLDWPRDHFQVHILDDGRREEFRQFAEESGCAYITRSDNAHAKAGNINAALTKTHGEYVAIFDCDHVPTRSFLQMTIGWFLKDERLGMLQTPHHFYSPDPFERNLKMFRTIPNEGELFYGLVQDGNDLWNATFFCGSCAVLRRTALEEIGGIAVETVTEDAHTSLRMQVRTWNTAYINIPQAAGLATESLSSHVGQRIRWARGMIQILRVDNPLTRPNLKLAQRVCYFNAMVHFLYAIPRLIFLTSPLIYLVLGHLNIRGYSLTIMAYALPHVVLSTMSNSRVQGSYRYSFWNEVYEAVLTPYILFPTMLALVNPKLGKFNVTAKGGLVPESYFDRKIARPYIALLFLNLLGLVFAALRLVWWDSAHPGTVIMNAVWTFYNVVILGVSCAVSHENKQRRTHVRVAFRGGVVLRLVDGRTLQADTTDISSTGVALRVPRGIGVEVGESVSMRFAFRFVRYDLPATVVGNESGRLRLEFAPLTPPQEEELTRVLYSRADSWLDFSKNRERDRPLKSLGLLVKLSMRGIGMAFRSFWGGLPTAPSEESDEDEKKTPSVKTAPAAGIILFILGSSFLHGAYLRAGDRQPSQGRTKAEASQPVDSKSQLRNSFHTIADLAGFGNLKPSLLHGTQSNASVRFVLSDSQVVTSATLNLQYRLAPQLVEQSTRLNVLVNGIQAASISLLHSSDNHTDQEASVTLPAEFLLTENTMEFQLAGVCASECTSQNVITYVDPNSQLEFYGSRLALASDLALLPAPFLDRTKQTPSVSFAFLAAPDSSTLRAAGILASWFGVITDYQGVSFTATIGAIPEENAVIVGPVSAMPPALGLVSVTGPTIAVCTNPSDPYSKLLVVTGMNEGQVIQAATALALGRVKASGDITKVEPFDEPAARVPDDAPRWASGDQDATLGDLFAGDQLRFKGFISQNLFFRVAPDIYFGNRGSIRMRLNFRLDGMAPQQRTELRIYLNTMPVATIPIISDGTPIQHASVALPITALKPYSNALLVSWEAVGWADSSAEPALQFMRNSSIDLGGSSHFLDMPKLERFAEAGYPFTRYADLSKSAVVLADNHAAGLLAEYLDLMGFSGAQTGYPAVGITIASPSEMESIKGKDLILLARYSDGQILKPLGAVLPVTVNQNSVRLSGTDDLWMRVRRSTWNPQGRTRQSIEDLLEADPGPAGLIAGFESPFEAGRSAVAILSQDDAAAAVMGSQISGVQRKGAIYGSISVFYNDRFESLYLTRDAYQNGTLPRYQALNLWFVRQIFLLPIWVVVCCWLTTIWVLPHIERQMRLRLEGKA
jgi:cellulose synthase (UDP-forming)